MKKFGILFIFVFMSCRHTSPQAQVQEAEPVTRLDCTATREFITAYEYLKSIEKGEKLKQEFERMAVEVSTGCSGAAERFVTTSQMLIKAGLDTASALALGIEVATEGPEESAAFNSVFKAGFTKEHLDLDLGSAIRLAKETTLKLEGNVEIVGQDFFKLTQFCLDRSGLNLPKPECAKLASKLAILNPKRAVKIFGMVEDFFKFARDSEGLNLSTGDTITLVDKLLADSPYALKEFEKAFEYASNKSGLGLGRQESINVATRISKNTRSQTEE